MNATYVIIGGGIAGVSCAESLAFLSPEENIILISSSSLIKTVTNIIPLSKTVYKFDVEENHSSTLESKYLSIKVINDKVINVDPINMTINTSTGIIINYKKLCICTGAKANVLFENKNPNIIGIRDTESVEKFSNKIKNAKKIIIIGNGGIATELIHEISNVDIIWVIKDKHISATFIDPGAAEFFQNKLTNQPDKKSNKILKRYKYTDTQINHDDNKIGAALGPDWHEKFTINGTNDQLKNVQIEYECELSRLLSNDDIDELNDDVKWPVYIELTNGKIIGCDFIVSATGVVPNTDLSGIDDIEKINNGYSVDWKLETSIKNIFAAGDCCTANWDISQHWIQMKLWTQAHQMGRYAAKSMYSLNKNDDYYQDFCFELFTHVTKFFGYKVVLLGLYNGQKLNNDYEILLRMTKDLEYIKLIIKNGKMQGAVLIGDTDLEEMCENLILDQLDLSIYGEQLLDPDIDIEDYFD